MAGELAVSHTTAKVVYAIIVPSLGVDGGKYWNGTTFETFAGGNWGNYDVAMTEDAGTGLYRANMPALPNTVGKIDVIYYERVGASPAVSDTKIAATRFNLGPAGWTSDAALLV